jgi:hypothetical protein
MHDGAPPHVLRIVRQHLNQTLGDQWLERAGAVSWPALSPDLNALDTWLWRHLKALLYPAPIRGLEVTQQPAENAVRRFE